MILTVTPNAAVDKTYRIPGFQLDKVNRPAEGFTVAGGKGINVARVYQTLGGTATATGFLAGANGRIVSDALAKERITSKFIQIPGETRVCIAVVDPETGTQTEINETGPSVAQAHIRELISCVERLLSQSRYEFVVLSGSLPPDAPPTLYADLIESAKDAGVKTVLDTSGAALRAGLRAGPWMVKPNAAELESIIKGPLNDMSALIAAGLRLREEHAIEMVALTRGAEGALLCAPHETWQAIPPSIEFASAVASGDSFLSAFLWAWLHGVKRQNAAYSLQLATGAGAANAAVIGAGFCSRESIFALSEQSVVTKIL